MTNTSRQPAGTRLAIPGGRTIGAVPGAVAARQSEPRTPGVYSGSPAPGGVKKTVQ